MYSFFVRISKLCCVFSGDDKRAEQLSVEIREIDERAKELDKMRTQSISSISYINERNRKKNVEEAEKAILVSYLVYLVVVVKMSSHLRDAFFATLISVGRSQSSKR